MPLSSLRQRRAPANRAHGGHGLRAADRAPLTLRIDQAQQAALEVRQAAVGGDRRGRGRGRGLRSRSRSRSRCRCRCRRRRRCRCRCRCRSRRRRRSWGRRGGRRWGRHRGRYRGRYRSWRGARFTSTAGLQQEQEAQEAQGSAGRQGGVRHGRTGMQEGGRAGTGVRRRIVGARGPSGASPQHLHTVSCSLLLPGRRPAAPRPAGKR